MAILGNEGTVVHLWRGLDDPASRDVVSPERREGYRCLHVTGEDGRVQTRVPRLE